MNRRTALFSSLLLAGLAPGKLLAQVRQNRRKIRQTVDEGDEDDQVVQTRGDEETDVPAEPGHVWRRFDISRYTQLDHLNNSPQNAIAEWVLRRTGQQTWYGEKIAVLSAGRNELRAFNKPKTLDQVAEIVERFMNPMTDQLSVSIRFVAAVDPSWRNLVYPRLNLLRNGRQGQQVWSLKLEDAAMVLTQMQVFQGFKLLANKKIDLINGQTITLRTTEGRFYTAGLKRSTSGGGYQADTQRLDEGVNLRFSPLLNFDGDEIEAYVELTANTVRSMHKTRVLAPREAGQNELTIDVPEVSETEFKQVLSWPVGQSLLISAGIHPGILQSKNGFLGLRIPGTLPTNTELLVFIDAAPVTPKRAARDRDRIRN